MGTIIKQYSMFLLTAMDTETTHRKIQHRLKYAVLVSLYLFINACASNIPQPIRKAPAEDISLTQVRQAPKTFLNKSVRWGGTIIAIENQENETHLTILAQPFMAYGEPIQGDESFGRFIAIVDSFLDPAIYAKGRAITVYGELRSTGEKKIGEFDYLYAMVKAQQIHLWEPQLEREHDPYPLWWNDPWYPYYPYHRHYLR